MCKLDTKKGEGGKLRLPGKRAIYSVKSAGWDAQSWAWVEVCPCKWPWFRSGVANLPANEQQRNLEGSSTGEKQRVSSKEWFRGRRIDPPWMEKEELPYYLHLNSQHREISFRIIYNSWEFYAFWNLEILINCTSAKIVVIPSIVLNFLLDRKFYNNKRKKIVYHIKIQATLKTITIWNPYWNTQLKK